MPDNPSTKNLWDKQDGETTPAWQAFRTYRDMGEERSFHKVAEKLSKSDTLMKRWASRWKWVVRVSAWDEHVDKRRQEATITKQEEMARRHVQIGQGMQGIAAAKLVEYQKRIQSGQTLDDIGPRDAVALADAGVKLERLVQGEPTERIDVPRIQIELVGANGDESKAD
jgi:hypothetical protein